MQKRLSWIGAVLSATVVLFVAAVVTNAGGPQPIVGVSEASSLYATASHDAPPNCDEICNDQVACEEVCRFGSDITCGEYSEYSEDPACVSCGSVCGQYQPCVQCLEEGDLTTCEGAQYSCGSPPAANCSSVCEEPSVLCSTPCWNGSSYSPSTCGAEHYRCDESCYQAGWDYSGVFEDYLRWDFDLQGYVVDCYAWLTYFDWDPCQSQPIQNLECHSFWVATGVPEGSCCDIYGSWYGCQNWYGC